MKLWVDDVRPAPEWHIWCKSVNEAKNQITYFENYFSVIPAYKRR